MLTGALPGVVRLTAEAASLLGKRTVVPFRYPNPTRFWFAAAAVPSVFVTLGPVLVPRKPQVARPVRSASLTNRSALAQTVTLLLPTAAGAVIARVPIRLPPAAVVA